MMKKIILILFVAFLSSCATNTSFNNFYQKNQKDADFSLGLSSSLIRPFLSDDEFEDVKPLLKKAKHVRILVFSDNYEEKSAKFDKFIKRSDFEKMVRIKEDDGQIGFFTLEDRNKIKEMVLEIRSDDELILLGLKTNITPDDLNKFVQ